MSCAGCDDCDQTAWHLHVTVNRRHESNWHPELWSGTSFVLDCNRVGAKPVRVLNLFHSDHHLSIVGHPRSYMECIPTVNWKGDEAGAARALFQLGVEFTRLGYMVNRLKMEAGPNDASERRALYCESHIKIRDTFLNRERTAAMLLPTSISRKLPPQENKYLMITVRRDRWAACVNAVDAIKHTFHDELVDQPRVEICTHDTNPELDKEWLTQ